ncbi:MAG: Sensor histidine kinase RcsC [Acidobacteria bacterium]|nr:Sensor histidine kinase RcsC [Acidobacteriota bacterium]
MIAKRPLILIVDDVPEDVAVYKRHLTRGSDLRYRVQNAGTGAKALAMFRRSAPDCVLLGFRLPDMDGLEILRALAGASGTLPCAVIMLTEISDARIAVDAIKSGAHDYLEKSWITPELLRSAVANAIEKAALQREAEEQWRELTIKNLALEQQLDELQREIAERKRAEDALRFTNERFTLAEAVSNGYIYDWNPESDQVERSSRFNELFGYSNGEVAGTADWWKRQIHPDDIERVSSTLEQRLRGQEPGKVDGYSFEYRSRHKDGRYLWVWDRGRLMRDDMGRVTRVIGSAVDITRRKLIEESLRESEEKFSKVFKASPHRISISTLDEGRYIDVNDAVLKLTGYEREEMIGHTADEIRILAEPDGREKLIQALRNRPFRDLEFQLRSKNGEIKTVLMSAEIITLNGQQCILTMSNDITERKQVEESLRESEERFRTLANTIPSIIWMAAADGTITFYNQQWFDYSGVSPGQDGDWLQIVIHPNDLELCLAEWTRAGELGCEFETELRIRRRDGEYRWFLARATPVPDAEGGISRWFGVATDINDRKQAEEALRESQERLNLAMEAAGMFVWETEVATGRVKSDFPERMMGMEPGSFGGTFDSFLTLVHPDDRESFLRVRQRALDGEGPYDMELRTLRADGSVRWGLVRAMVYRDEQGDPKRIVGADVDITNRKRIEDELQRANRRYHLALDVLDGYVYEYNVREKVSERSEGLAKLIGFEPEETPPQVEWWFGLTHPDDRDRVISTVERMLAEDYPETTYSFEYRVLHREGRYIDVLDSGLIVRDAEGRPSQVVGAIVNITARKRADEALRESEEQTRRQNAELENIYQAAPIGLSLIDRDFRIMRMNEMRAEIDGVTVSQALGRSVREVTPDLADRLEPILKRVIRTGRPVMNLEIHGVIAREPGIERDWLVSYYPVKGADGSVQSVGSVVLDITDRKRAEEAVREREERLRLAAQSAGFGLYNMDLLTGEIYWSPELKQIFGLSNDAVILMDKWAEWIHLDDREKTIRATEVSFDPRGNGEFESEHRALRPDGSVRWVLMKGKTLFSGKGRKRKAVRAMGVAFDITERKEAEERLHASEKRFRTIFDLSGIGILQVEPATGRFLRANREFCSWLGYSEDELLKMSFGEITHPGDRKDKLGKAARFLRGEMDEYSTEVRCVRKDGGIVWGLVTSRMLSDADGHPLRTVTAVQDITERKRFEEALIASEERYRNLIETANEGIWLVDAEANILYVNERMANLLGYKAEEINGRKVPEFCFEQDRTKAVERANANLRGDYQEFDFRFRRGDDSELHVRASTSPVYDAQGGVVGAMGMFTDITTHVRAEESLRKSERRLKLSLTAGRAGMWEWRIRDDRLIWSDEYYEVFGMKPGDLDSTLENFLLCIHPEDRDRMLAEMSEVLQERKDAEHEFRFIRPDGVVRWAQSKAQLTLDESGEPERLVGILIDITEHKQAEMEREDLLRKEQEARAQAEAANRGKDEFVAMISHELRSPLNAMLGWSKILKKGDVDEKTHSHAVEVIERSARAQQNIIEDLLDMARIVGGKLRVEARPVNLARVIEAAADVVRPAATAREIDLRLSINSADEVTGDADRLQQVIWNLLSNAVKFTPHGGSVELILERVGASAQITVNDTGRGIKAEDLPFIFDRFRQADSSGSRRFAGLGLGLALVKHLVELHGGQVSADSVGEGKGASFIVKLPVRAVRGEAALGIVGERDSGRAGEWENGRAGEWESGRAGEWESGRAGERGGERRRNRETRGDLSPSPSLPFSPSSPLPLQGVWALIVDDEADARDLVEKLLSQYGARVTTASCAAEAFDKLRKGEAGKRPDVLVSDISMPDEDGYMLIERVRRLPLDEGGKIPAIALTAFERPNDRIKALASGFSMHVPKPVEPEELAMVIANLTGHPGKRMNVR